jgi:ATPase complex subunit ATP10
MKYNTPLKEHDTTLLYFGSDVDEFRDVLRMHNIMTNYIFLIDDLGRIRFAGSGPATENDIAALIQCTKELAAEGKPKNKNKRR